MIHKFTFAIKRKKYDYLGNSDFFYRIENNIVLLQSIILTGKHHDSSKYSGVQHQSG